MRKSKNSDTERLDDTTIERAIAFLENKGTKKGACEILNIKYNTARLDTLIEKYKTKKSEDAKRRSEKRGKPATEGEIKYAIQAYLEGSPIDAISKSLYRGPTFVKNILISYAVPLRQSAHSYFKPELIPDDAVRTDFRVGEVVYSARYDSLAKVVSEWKPGVYGIWLKSDRWQQYAYQPAEELASLEHLTKLGISF